MKKGEEKFKIVTIGGGTGSFSILSALREKKEEGYPLEISAIVAMSDSGGSSGVLMDQYGVLPAGDIRQALVALSPHSKFLRKLFSYRYSDGFLEGHSFGNIFLSTIEKITGSFAKALREAEKVLKISGRIYPITFDKHELVADLKGGKQIVSEKNFDNVDLSGLERIYFSEKVSLNKKIPALLEKADAVVVAPGSFFTSIVPNFLVPDFSELLKKSSAKKFFIVNTTTEKGQTDNFKVLDFLRAMDKYAGFSDFDFVLYNTNTEIKDKETLERYKKEGKFFIKADDSLVWKKSDFVGKDFLNKPSSDCKHKNFIRCNPEALVEEILKLSDE